MDYFKALIFGVILRYSHSGIF